MKNLLRISVAVVGFCLAARSAQAQNILWGSAQTMTGTNDVFNPTGSTLLDAITFNGSALTINGVTFNPANTSGNSHADGTGIITVTNGDSTGAFGASFTTTAPSSASYSSLLNAGTFGEFTSANSSDLVTLGSVTSPLTIGDSYDVEAWSYYTGDDPTTFTTYSGTNTVLLENHIGQYAIGSFTATSATETFNYYITGPQGHDFINAVSLFQAAPIPEPSTTCSLTIGFFVLVGLMRKRLSAVFGPRAA